MGLFTPQFLFDLESRMQRISENEYARLSANLWWSRFAKVRSSTTRRELITWFLSTAKIEDLETSGGKQRFDDMVSKYTEFTNKHAGTALRLKKDQFEDTDGDGVDAASQWSADVSAYAAYWPQKQATYLLKNGHSSGFTSYDGEIFFSNAHPVNPFDTSKGTFANIFTGAASSTPSTDPNDATYPGAIVLDESVTLDVAFQNLSKAISYIKGIRMPNGEDPRFLKPVALAGGPRMQNRLVQLAGSKFIAQAASSGGGSADVEKMIQWQGLAEPIIMDEFSGFESETTTFLICEQVTSSQMGGLVYVDREPFKISFYDGAIDADLDRRNELEWHMRGRNVMGYGHPYAIYKLKAS